MAATTGNRTVMGLFDNHDDAERCLSELRDAGVRGEDISLVASDYRGSFRTEKGTGETTDKATMGENIAGGAIFGGLGGLLIGLGALAIPGLGPIVAAGPLATTLAGAGIGAVGGGIVGAIREAGVTEEEAHIYAEGVRRGGTLVIVMGSSVSEDMIMDVMDRHGAVDIEERETAWRSAGWSKFDPNAGPYEHEMAAAPSRASRGTAFAGPDTTTGMAPPSAASGSSGSAYGTQTGSATGSITTGGRSLGTVRTDAHGGTSLGNKSFREGRRLSRTYYR